MDMDRCEKAYALHKAGFNCAQAVAGSFADQVGIPETTLMASLGGFGGGIGGSHTELCGAVSGGVMVLGLLFPHTEGADRAGKQRTYALAKEFRRRFEAVFGKSRCGDLLSVRPGPSEKTRAAQRLQLTSHCDIMIVTAVEILEELLLETGA